MPVIFPRRGTINAVELWKIAKKSLKDIAKLTDAESLGRKR